jgi:uncharacterized membrane protein
MLLSLLLHGDAVASSGLFGYDMPRLHAVINDFPPALLVVGVFFQLAYLFTKRESLRSAAYWSLVVGAVTTAAAVFSGLRAEDAIQHGQAIHEIMETHERFAWITLGFFGVIAVWLVLRDATMLRKERWALAVIGVVGLGFLTATGMEGGEMVFDHAAGMSTEAMQAEIQNREGGHEHAPGEEHDDAGMPTTMDSSTAVTDTIAAAAKPTHTHAPGTPAHTD